DGARSSLIESCIVEALVGGRVVDALDVPDDAIEALGDALVAADPALELRVELACAMCDQRWSPVVDPALYFWQELAAAGTQILDDVHALAVGYGWSEAEVLELSARR